MAAHPCIITITATHLHIMHFYLRLLKPVLASQDESIRRWSSTQRQIGFQELFSFLPLFTLIFDDCDIVFVLRIISDYLFKRLEREHFEFTLVKQIVVTWNVL